MPRLLSAAARAPQLPPRPGPILRRRGRMLLRGAAPQDRLRRADLSHVRRAGLRRLVPSVYIEFCLYYRLEGDTGGVRGFDSASTRDGRPVLFRELMSVISSWYSSRSESAWRSFSWQLRVSARSSSLSAASTAFRASAASARAVSAWRLRRASSRSRLIGYARSSASRAHASSATAAAARRSRSACVARHRACAPWCAFSAANRWTSFATRRFSVALRSASVPPLRRRRRRRLGARGRDDLGEGGHGFSITTRRPRTQWHARRASGFSALF